MSGGSVKINGVQYAGKNISIQDGKVFVDGNERDQELNEKVVNVSVEGAAEHVSTVSGNISISGNVSCSVNTTSGGIECNNILGDVTTVSGDIDCGDVYGNVKTVSGDICKK